MTRFRGPSLGVFVALGIFLALGVATGAATSAVPVQDFPTQTSSVPAPLQANVSPPVVALLPNPQAEIASRDAQIGDHHLPGPPLEPLTTPPALPPQPSVQAVTVSPINVALITNRALGNSGTSGVTSQVGEPSVGVRGTEILYTGNWYAAFSSDGGANFAYRNPSTTFPSANGGFCCDQVALYVPGSDLMIWYLQYIEQGGANTARVAVAQGADIAAEQWHYYDFTPQTVGGWTNEWFDFPDLAAGTDFLYLTTNAYNTAGSFARSVILRLPLADLAAYQGFTYNYFDTTQFGSLRPTQGATNTMYFGSHRSLATMRVFTWPENSTTINGADVGVEAWSNSTRVAPGPDGRDWLDRADHRVTAAWASGGQIGFAWTASQDGTYPFPHVRVAVMNASSKAIIAQPHIWANDTAFAYPAAAPNSTGVVGIAVFRGGGPNFPSALVGYLADAATADWRLAVAGQGTDGPNRNVSGDYLAVRPHPTQAETWVATGFAQDGGPTASDVEPRYIHFRLRPDGLQIALENLDPTRRLDVGETTTVRATVTDGGNRAAGRTVDFTSNDTGLATVEPSATTNAAGVAEVTVTGQSRSRDTATVTGTVDGESDTAEVRVPDLSIVGLVALLLVLVAGYELLHRRERGV